MHVLIAGCGWLGAEIGRRLLAEGHRVTGIRRDPAAAAALDADGIEPLILDLTAEDADRRLPGDVDAIVGCQAAGARGEEAYERAYIEATRPLLDLARRRPSIRLVYTGSTGVFGPGDGPDVDETSLPRPAGGTGEVLRRAETQLLEAAASGVDVSIVRLSGLYGPQRYGVLDRIRSGRLALGPDDASWMNFCHRDDAATTVLALLDRGRAGQVYHASDAHPSRRRDVIAWVAERLGVEPSRASAGAAGVGGRPPALRRVAAERTRRELGIELAYPSFREGLEQALRRSD